MTRKIHLHKFRIKTMTFPFNEATHFNEGYWHTVDGEKIISQRFI